MLRRCRCERRGVKDGPLAWQVTGRCGFATVRITIFGGTGPTGRLLIQDALPAGHQVTAYARTPAALPERDRLMAVEGQLVNRDAIAMAIHRSGLS